MSNAVTNIYSIIGIFLFCMVKQCHTTMLPISLFFSLEDEKGMFVSMFVELNRQICLQIKRGKRKMEKIKSWKIFEYRAQ